jgi:carbon-monoxide dehydrogenase small subunit
MPVERNVDTGPHPTRRRRLIPARPGGTIDGRSLRSACRHAGSAVACPVADGHTDRLQGKEVLAVVEHIALDVNGARRELDVEPRRFLVQVLREDLNLTGTHVGCDTSQCGACTVHVDGRPVKSCTMLGVQADGTQVTTIEGLATDGELHPMQTAFWEKHGLQCGFCTPGMIMTAVDLLARNPDPTDEEIRHAIEGNICRCTGYQNIVTAIRAAGAAMRAAPAPTA